MKTRIDAEAVKNIADTLARQAQEKALQRVFAAASQALQARYDSLDGAHKLVADNPSSKPATDWQGLHNLLKSEKHATKTSEGARSRRAGLAALQLVIDAQRDGLSPDQLFEKLYGVEGIDVAAAIRNTALRERGKLRGVSALPGVVSGMMGSYLSKRDAVEAQLSSASIGVCANAEELRVALNSNLGLMGVDDIEAWAPDSVDSGEELQVNEVPSLELSTADVQSAFDGANLDFVGLAQEAHYVGCYEQAVQDYKAARQEQRASVISAPSSKQKQVAHQFQSFGDVVVDPSQRCEDQARRIDIGIGKNFDDDEFQRRMDMCLTGRGPKQINQDTHVVYFGAAYVFALVDWYVDHKRGATNPGAEAIDQLRVFKEGITARLDQPMELNCFYDEQLQRLQALDAGGSSFGRLLEALPASALTPAFAQQLQAKQQQVAASGQQEARASRQSSDSYHGSAASMYGHRARARSDERFGPAHGGDGPGAQAGAAEQKGGGGRRPA